MNITVNSDLTVHVESGDQFFRLANNPRTGLPFSSEEEARACAIETAAYNPWMPLSMLDEQPPERRLELTPPEFKLQFTSAERIAMRAARAYAGTDETKLATQAVIDDWFDIIDDPRLTTVDLNHESTQQGVAFLVASGILTQARADEVLAGVPA